MQRKNPNSALKQQALAQCLNSCLPKILQILDVTVNKLVLEMDQQAAKRTAEKFKELQNNNYISVEKRLRGENAVKQTALIDVEGKERLRLLLADTIIDLLNVIFEIDVKTNVMRTTEVSQKNRRK